MNLDGIVSLLFFCIEFVLLLNVLYFSRKKKSLVKGAFVIALLAGYQLIEYMICGIGLKYSLMAFLAFADISFLPPLSLLFIMDLLKIRFKLDWLIFIPALSLLLYYLMVLEEFEVVKCSVIYAVYRYPLGDIYGLFYYLPILALIFLLISSLKSKTALQKKNIITLLLANIFVCLPVIIAFILHFTGYSDMLKMIESVMCKFALIIAVCYALVILNLSRNDSIE